MFQQIAQVVRDWFAERNIPAVVAEGADARAELANIGDEGDRVVFVPAAPIATGAPKFIGDEPRQLLNTTFAFEVSFAGYDPSEPDRDFAHRARCYALWEATVQAIQRAYYGVHQWTGARWEDTRKHGRHGAELIATLVIDVPLFDIEWTEATPAPLPGEPKPAT